METRVKAAGVHVDAGDMAEGAPAAAEEQPGEEGDEEPEMVRPFFQWFCRPIIRRAA